MSKPKVQLQVRDFGIITLELEPEKAPASVENFLRYVNSGHYDNTIFHRVIPGFMVQGGGFEPGMTQKSSQAPVQNEAANGLRNDNYSVAMARTSDPHSASAQFFINIANNEFLNHTSPTASGWGYAVFGRVSEGSEVVDKIAAAKTSQKAGHADVPRDDVVIEKATVVAEA